MKLIISWCMGTVRSWPEPVIKHLGKGCSQPREHRWNQFTCAVGSWLYPSLTSFKGWKTHGKNGYLETASLGVFGLPQSSEKSKKFLLYYCIVTVTFLGSRTAVFPAACSYVCWVRQEFWCLWGIAMISCSSVTSFSDSGLFGYLSQKNLERQIIENSQTTCVTMGKPVSVS